MFMGGAEIHVNAFIVEIRVSRANGKDGMSVMRRFWWVSICLWLASQACQAIGIHTGSHTMYAIQPEETSKE